MQWRGTWHTKRWSRRSYSGTAILKKLFDQELSEHEADEKFNYCRCDTADHAILTTFTATYKEHNETLIGVTDDLTRHSYIAKLKINSYWYRAKSSPYLEMLLINMMKLLFLSFLLISKMDFTSCNLWSFNSRRFSYSNILIVFSLYSWVSGS